ncbi:MAG: hypothetical protein ACJAS6_001145 [Rickettsiales bacterium]|jgi:hypothetical protein
MIFDDKKRSDSSYKKFNETTYDFLDRTSTERYEIVRSDINRIASFYPDGLLKNKLISSLTRGNFEETFFELFLYDFLIAKKFETTPEPKIEGLAPDFLVKRDKDSFLVEATTLNNPKWMSETSNRRGALIQSINNNVFSDYFYLSIDFIDESINPKTSEIINFLKQTLEEESSNYESLKEQKQKLDSKIINYVNRDNNFRVEFELIPKSFPKSNERVIGASGMISVSSVNYNGLSAPTIMAGF